MCFRAWVCIDMPSSLSKSSHQFLLIAQSLFPERESFFSTQNFHAYTPQVLSLSSPTAHENSDISRGESLRKTSLTYQLHSALLPEPWNINSHRFSPPLSAKFPCSKNIPLQLRAKKGGSSFFLGPQSR